ncbi:metal ABC transporter solute-binding protein, Zn/Mn family [Sporosarcina limicola]|uniref:Zinc transport system substrate-binding protein n=1 Tax=Sporosarcina limicola TaxID=34101 RepID=A0A927MQF1_9BACL|nr:zinc ABC transporter substrate-binding protein [Sporosarcina limicola]MBE1555461.1 zinc transport system substrate-binding protein [Sporosarcina limicola]
MNKKLVMIISIFTLILLTACGNKDSGKDKPAKGTDADKLSVYTTVYPLQYFTERIGGEHVDVKSIYPPGADEHTFDPTQKDMMGLADSDLFFYIGLGLEGFVENAEKTMKGQNVKMVATAEGISKDQLGEGHRHEGKEGHEGHDHGKDGHEDEDHSEDGHDQDESHDHSGPDPHVWISPTLSVELATSIKNALVEKSPELEDEFEKNFETLQQDLIELDGKFKEMASNAPTKTFFVSHAAFGYIANPYGLEQVAIAGLNSQSEPSQKQLTKIVEAAKEKNVKYVLFEQNVSSKLTDVVRKEIGAESLMLHNLGVLTTENVKNKETYFTLMEKNITMLKKALGGK